MIVNYDYFSRLESPILTLCNPSDSIVCQIAEYQDLNLDLCFNDQSEMTFKVYKYIKRGKKNQAYDKLKCKREILVSGLKTDNINSSTVDLGYFYINEVNEETEENGKIYKEVKAYSCEYELTKTELHYIDGVYKLYDANSSDCLLAEVFNGNPKWKVIHVDPSIATLYRTFEFGKNTVYNFLISELSEAYGAIVQFDILNRTVSFYDKSTYIESQNKRTHISISRNDIVNSIRITQSEDQLYTCLYVTGDNGLDISSVNPLGGNTLINVNYFEKEEWMSQELLSSLNTWKTKLNSYDLEENQNVHAYYELNNIPSDKKIFNDFYIITHNTESIIDGETIVDITYTNCDIYKYDGTDFNSITYNSIDKFQALLLLLQYENEKSISIENELNYMTTMLEGLEDEKSAVISSSESDTAKNEQLTIINSNINTTQTQIAQASITWENKLSVIDSIQSGVIKVNSDLSLSNNFSEKEYSELSSFVSEGTYEDKSITITDNMTYAEKQQQALALYKKSKELLETISQPAEEFDIETDGGLFHKSFSKFIKEINTGCIIGILDDDGVNTERILQNIHINYEDKKIGLTFGNRFKPQSPRDVFQDLYSEASKTSNTVDYLNQTFNFGDSKEKISDFETFRKSSLDLTKNSIISSSNQEFLIGRNGIIGRKLLPSGSGFENDQLWITNNTIVFTSDGFQTINTALGKLTLPDGSAKYGLNADIIIAGSINASLIKAGKIQSEDGSCYFDLENNILLASRLGYSDTYAKVGLTSDRYAGFELFANGKSYMTAEQAGDEGFGLITKSNVYGKKTRFFASDVQTSVMDKTGTFRFYASDVQTTVTDRTGAFRFYSDDTTTFIRDANGQDRFSSNAVETVVWLNDNNYFTITASSAYLVRGGGVVWSV